MSWKAETSRLGAETDLAISVIASKAAKQSSTYLRLIRRCPSK